MERATLGMACPARGADRPVPGTACAGPRSERAAPRLECPGPGLERAGRGLRLAGRGLRCSGPGFSGRNPGFSRRIPGNFPSFSTQNPKNRPKMVKTPIFRGLNDRWPPPATKKRILPLYAHQVHQTCRGRRSAPVLGRSNAASQAAVGKSGAPCHPSVAAAGDGRAPGAAG
jgi:hypothetical protein